MLRYILEKDALINDRDLCVWIGVKDGFLDAIKIDFWERQAEGNIRVLRPDLKCEKDLFSSVDLPETPEFLKKVEVA